MGSVHKVALVMALALGALTWGGCSDLGDPPAAGCSTDLECHGERICEDGRCVYPPGANNTTQGDMGDTSDMGGDMGEACPASAPTRCEGVCTNTNTDPNRCGDCAAVCADGWGCSGGTCVPPQSGCTPGSCAGLMWCNTDAGRCEPGCESSAACPSGQTCEDHQCACPEDTRACDAGCCPIQTECITGKVMGGPAPFIIGEGPLTAAVNTPMALEVTFSRAPASFAWTLRTRPATSQAALQSGGVASKQQLTPDVAGQYVVEVTALDEAGAMPCEPILMEITATETTDTPDVLIQLTWDTPNDPNQTDSIGTDLDLHYLRPGATAWDMAPGAIFWRNITEDWGVAGAADDPSMDIDDTDGAGPEVISHSPSQAPGLYPVGVFYYNDNGFGASYATLRVYVKGVLKFEQRDQYLEKQDKFWFPLSIQQPGNIIVPKQGTTIFTGYPAVTP